jgi:hypothetical protein
MITARLTTLMLAVSALLCSASALAGSASFGLSLTGSQLSVINQGNIPAFYPAVFRMLADGSWVQLRASNAVAELLAGANLELAWPDARPLEEMPELERMQPVMVRFFDQSGVSFGQIALFHPPPTAKTALKAGYVNGALQIEPPDGVSSVRAGWVLWAQEEGIDPIRGPMRFTPQPPPAVRIDWSRDGRALRRLDTGAGQPAVTLLHETEQGYAQQFVPDGGRQGREQRAAWLDAAPQFYGASVIALVFAAGAMVVQFLRRPRARSKTESARP